ncbi:AMP-binding protein [Jiulongibacter sp. NS-SX5]|uniref:AMP-binding protein n=1 Tax=Jiulongibacter sp. NS-SX5 TaxID=3463854 RepID=UPI004059A844
MIFVSQEGDLTNSAPNDPYFQKVKRFIIKWQNGLNALEVKTSGSTGKPKNIKLTKQQVKASVAQTAKAFSLTEESFFLCNLSIDFIAGKLMVIRALELGSELLIIKPEGSIIDNLGNFGYMLEQKRGQCFLAFVPLQLNNLLQDERGQNLLNMAQATIIGGAAISNSLARQISEINTPVYATFGMTETVTHFAIKRLNGNKPDGYFIALDGTDIKANEEGKLCIKNECTENKWLVTNDLAEIINTHEFKLSGRSDRVINSGGIKLSLDEIETKIDQILNLSAPFFCSSLPDEKLGQQLALFIEGAGNAIEIKEKLKKEMAKFEAPKIVAFIKSFERTVTGKIDKRKTTNAYSVSNK